MKHEIIKTDNYLLAVGKDRKRGWFYCVRTKSFFHDEGEDVLCCNGDLPIDAHLPLNGSPILEGVDLLPALEDDTESVALKHFHCCDVEQIENLGMTKAFSRWVDGYNQAKEKYNLTLEKILDLYIQETGYGMDMWSKEENAVMSVVAKIIQSLSQPKMPIGFERYHNYVPTMLGEHIAEAKTTTTPEGHTQWIGTYIYE